MLEDATEYLEIFETIGEHEDLSALLDRRDDVDNIEQLAVDLQALINLHLLGLFTSIQSLITNDMRPALDNVPSGSMVPSPGQWRIREYLSWKKPGQFTRALIERAEQAVRDGDPGAA
jgi:hypothetical protein